MVADLAGSDAFVGVMAIVRVSGQVPFIRRYAYTRRMKLSRR